MIVVGPPPRTDAVQASVLEGLRTSVANAVAARGDVTIGHASFGDAFAATATFLPDGVHPAAAGQDRNGGEADGHADRVGDAGAVVSAVQAASAWITPSAKRCAMASIVNPSAMRRAAACIAARRAGSSSSPATASA